MAVTKIEHCDACDDLITSVESKYRVTIQDEDGKQKRYLLCGQCTDSLKSRIRNGELDEAYQW